MISLKCLIKVEVIFFIFLLAFGCGSTGDKAEDTTNTYTSVPTIKNVTPYDKATNVSIDIVIKAIFNEKIDSGTLNEETFKVDNGVTGIITYDFKNNKATMTPDIPLNNLTNYTVTITSGVKNLDGNALAEDYIWTFTTGIETNSSTPSVVLTKPDNNETDVSINTKLLVFFSEKMNAETINDTTFFLDNGVAYTVTYDDTNNTAALIPDTPLDKSTTYAANEMIRIPFLRSK